jgi:hypothetical protein
VNIMRDWKVCLKEYLDNYYRGYLKETETLVAQEG